MQDVPGRKGQGAPEQQEGHHTMSELSQGLITFYILGVVFAFYLGLGAYRNKDTRIGARFLLASFVWPLAALLAGIRALFYWVPRLWREAFGDA
jgi:hypothetical protein